MIKKTDLFRMISSEQGRIDLKKTLKKKGFSSVRT
jgi:hypothetical protein